MNNTVIENKLEGDKGVFALIVDGVKLGEMLYKIYPNERLDIKHTEIDPKQRGKGLAIQIVSAAVMLARDMKIKISSSCPYANAVLQRTEEYSDIYLS